MINSDNVAIIGALALAGAALTLGMNDTKPVIENWNMDPPKAVKAIPSYAANRADAESGKIFAAPPSLQAMLPPRFNPNPLGANISFNPPNVNNMAYRLKSPFAQNVAGNKMHTALGFNTGSLAGTRMPPVGKNLKEGFVGMEVDGMSSAGSGRMDSMQLNSMNPSLLPNVISGQALSGGGDDPVFGAGAGAGNDNADNPVVFDRFITANLSSRLRSQADKIRGDLAIPPCNSGWFQVSVNPAVDLEPGALAVMGGIYNEQCQAISSLVNMASGGTKTAIGGVDMSAAIDTCLAGAGNDVTAIAFP